MSDDRSATYPKAPGDFEIHAYIPDSMIVEPHEWPADNPLVCIEDAECYVMAYVPQSRAAAVLRLLELGMAEYERRQQLATDEGGSDAPATQP
jgi:hypothetical protein